MVANYLFRDRDGQTPLPPELRRGLIPKHIVTIGELDEHEEQNIAEGMVWLKRQNGGDYESLTAFMFSITHGVDITD